MSDIIFKMECVVKFLFKEISKNQSESKTVDTYMMAEEVLKALKEGQLC